MSTRRAGLEVVAAQPTSAPRSLADALGALREQGDRRSRCTVCRTLSVPERTELNTAITEGRDSKVTLLRALHLIGHTRITRHTLDYHVQRCGQGPSRGESILV